jgi:hypothetical protein
LAMTVLVGGVLLGGAALFFNGADDPKNDSDAIKLSASIEDAIESDLGYDIAVHCKKRRAGAFVCPIEEDPGSGADQINLITLDPERCWEARMQVPRGHPTRPEKSYSDCLD